MAILNNNQLGGASGQGGGYTLDNSLRFRSSASAYLYSTESSSNRQTMTWSGWVKLGTLSTDRNLISYSNGGTTTFGQLGLSSANAIDFISYSSGVQSRLITTQLFRDASAWYHIIAVFDTTNATSTERLRLYINGERVTAFSSTTYPSINYQAHWNNGFQGKIGAISVGATGNYLDGYMTEVNFVDGQALTAADFGETNEDTGSWQPKKYSGSYGTNGFYLKGRGTDNSGNSNDWTENNFNTSDSTLTTYDIMSDVPTLTDEDTANYCVMNPLDKGTSLSISDANLTISTSTASWFSISSTIKISEKIYAECTYKSSGGSSTHEFGIRVSSLSNISSVEPLGDANGAGVLWNNIGYKSRASGAETNIVTTTVAIGSVFQIAFDASNGNLWVGKDNSWLGGGNPSTNTTPTYTGLTNTNGYNIVSALNITSSIALNFGQRPFTYTPPTGYKKLNTFNLPDSNIVDGSEHFNTVLYTAAASNGTYQITGNGFQPDFSWVKNRDNVERHFLFDVIRGNSSMTDKFLVSSDTSAEGANGVSGTTVTVNSDGMEVVETSINTGEFYYSGRTYVMWNWKANGTGVSNTDGSITSTVSANTTAGFSIVSYTGNATVGATVGHGLSIAPELVMSKNRIDVGSWNVWSPPILGNGYWMPLNDTAASSLYNATWSTNATNLVLADGGGHNGAGDAMIAYCFASVEGYSKIGTYVGNGSTDGPFIYTGFRPAFVMVKKTSATSNWTILDNTREGYNVDNDPLYPNLSSAEGTTDLIDLLSNGFKLRSTDASINTSSGTYIYMAFASNPFKNSLAR